MAGHCYDKFMYHRLIQHKLMWIIWRIELNWNYFKSEHFKGFYFRVINKKNSNFHILVSHITKKNFQKYLISFVTNNIKLIIYFICSGHEWNSFFTELFIFTPFQTDSLVFWHICRILNCPVNWINIFKFLGRQSICFTNIYWFL